jgi:hypothetical protein
MVNRLFILAVLISLFLANEALDAVESWPVFQRITAFGGASARYDYHELR